MHEHNSSTSDDYWYREAGAVEHWFYGVFEGGGAKGVAFSGALLAMKEKKCWFRGVAGASAGAITAALVASGLPPEKMDKATDEALNQLQTGCWAGLKRLRNETGYFPADRLRGWLDGVLRKQVERKSGIASVQGKVTFQQLFDATGIELNVVAANLSLRQQVIFSHLDTPNCAVADAVVASSSIPFAFPSSLLRVPDPKGESYFHDTIVDGGVWSNFPLFIFEDSSFRHGYGRNPDHIESQEILGFLLDKQTNQEIGEW